MSELDQIHNKIVPDTQLVAEINKEYTLKFSMSVQGGLTLFAVYPTRDWECKKVTITSIAIAQLKKTTDGKDRVTPKAEHKAHYDPEAIYIWAINSKVAVKKCQNRMFNFIKRKSEIEAFYNQKTLKTNS